MRTLPKTYDPKSVEPKIQKLWERFGYSNPDKLPKRHKKPFTIMMAPPNVTGGLHIGHAVFMTLQDILIRFWRMRGRKALWLPGTDHAAIATSVVVEGELYKKEGKTRHDIGREEFIKRAEEFARHSRDMIVRQLKSWGASADWSREAYTLDKERSLAVRTAFKRMYDEGLIYRGEYLVNWDPKLQTTISDDEIEWREEKANLYYLKYGPFTIATVRPETKFGDKYVVMHPNDKRYRQYAHGKKIELEWINGPITATAIKDSAIDMEFGTGVMTITPAHDRADADIAERHKLERDQIINEYGKLLPIAGEFAGMSIVKARPLIIEKLKQKGLLEKVEENYTHRIATNSRGGGVIELLPKRHQCFVAVNKAIPRRNRKTLRGLMREPIVKNRINIIPKHFKKVYLHWINNLRDWNISRQIWFGHKIPIWYCNNKNDQEWYPSRYDHPMVSVETITQCQNCGGPVEQESDTLDTWFSSALWTFSTLGWPTFAQSAKAGKPGPENDLANFHPTDVLETGYDILFFWVARMILMTTYILGDIPFRTVYLHGLVRDKDRQKMSKSKGNVIDPLGVADLYGTDAVRMSLIMGTTAGNDLVLSEEKILGYRNFANKIWNIARFILMQGAGGTPHRIKLTARDQKRIEGVRQLAKRVTRELEAYRFHHAGELLYHYIWHTFADKIVEEAKPRLNGGDDTERAAALHVLRTIFLTSLKLLHPFMPHISEELWQHLQPKTGNSKQKADLLMIQPWLTPKP